MNQYTIDMISLGIKRQLSFEVTAKNRQAFSQPLQCSISPDEVAPLAAFLLS